MKIGFTEILRCVFRIIRALLYEREIKHPAPTICIGKRNGIQYELHLVIRRKEVLSDDKQSTSVLGE